MQNAWELVQSLAVAAALDDGDRLDQARTNIQARIPNFSAADEADMQAIIDYARSEDSTAEDADQRFEQVRDHLISHMGKPAEALAAASA